MVNTERLCMGCMNDNGGEKICPICGYDSAADNPAQYLSVGTWLNANRYLIGRVIEENGDSAVYIAWDNDNNSVVNVTEYLPVGIARRSADRLTVSPNDNDGLSFNRGKTEFFELHTTLSNVKISGILPILDIFESNGTVYSVSGVVSSISLKDFLIRNGGVLKWEQVKPLFMPLLSTLNDLHNVGIAHRGISLENILVGRDGRLYLSGFSIKAARCANTEFAYKLAAGFAAPEQYDPEAEVGFACDIYAVGAVLFRCVIGSMPPDAKERIQNDKLSIPANAAENVSRGALAAIANALKIDPEARTASADRFKKMIEVAVGTVPFENASEIPKKKKSNSKKYAIIASVVTALFFVIVVGGLAIFMDFGKLFDNGDGDSSSINTSSNNYEPVFPQVNIKYNDNGIEVSDWSGKTYSDLVKELNDQNIELEVVIIGKVYSDTYEKGLIVDQTVKEGKVEPNSEIGVYISLGKSTLIMPEIIGLTCDKAKVKLFEAGFSSENIVFRPRYSGEPGTVTASTIKPRETVSADEVVIVDYCPETESSDVAQGQSLTENN